MKTPIHCPGDHNYMNNKRRRATAVEVSEFGNGLEMEFQETGIVFPRSSPGAVPFNILFRVAGGTTAKC